MNVRDRFIRWMAMRAHAAVHCLRNRLCFDPMRLLLGCCLSLALTGLIASGAQAASPGARPPNIVILVADDWGFTDVGAFGSEIPTPHLDALAARGMRFSNFHVSGSCSPTRSMLLTGVDNHLAGVGNLRESMPHQHAGQPGYLGSLNRNVVTVAELLRTRGYRTYVTGKWNVGNEPHNLPNQRGFDRSLIQGDTGSDNWNPSQRYLGLTDQVYWFEDGRAARMPERFYSSEFFVDKMIGYLKEGAAQPAPFLAYIGFQANHIPLQAPRAFIDPHRGKYDAGWAALRQARRDRAAALGLIPADAPMQPMSDTPDWASLNDTARRYEARRMEVYAGMAQAMDHHVGRLIAHLRDSGELERTVFVFLSDNGAEASDPYDSVISRLWLRTSYRNDLDAMGDPGAYAVIGPNWARAVASPLSTYKFFAGEGGVRVPLIVSGVPGTTPGSIHPGFTHVTDIVPTLLALSGAQPAPPSTEGRRIEPPSGVSLLPVILGQQARARPADVAVGHELSGNAAMYRGDLKLVRNLPPLGDGQWRLFDIVRDPGETQDLSITRADELQVLQRLYADWEQAHGVLPMPAGYRYAYQVMRNAVMNVYVPRYGPWVAIALSGLILLTWLRLRRRRARAVLHHRST
jgi:arylsulfatase A-like enzyme